nr:fatty acid desaturase [Oculatellaceae cyanobacterium Prado106]
MKLVHARRLSAKAIRKRGKQSTTAIDSPASLKGLISALTIMTLWFISLSILLWIDVSQMPTWGVIAAVFFQAFLYTGLFINAHDAIHGSLFPGNLRLNHFLGAVSVFLYVFLPYKKMLKNHHRHHRNPATSVDPDFHRGWNKNILLWYLGFMFRYFTWKQFLMAASLYNIAHLLLHFPEPNLTYFWIIPPLLSSVQLFYFGTYLPHRETAAGYTNDHHRARSCSLPPFLSFLTCYHFGYHEEHHA